MDERLIWQGKTAGGDYRIVEMSYNGRLARVLYNGDRQAAQSGIPLDGDPTMLFEYNQRLCEIAEALQPRRVLILGGGVGTLAVELLRAVPYVQIDMVDPDVDLTALGRTYFGVPTSGALRQFATDARTFLSEHATRYDMVVLDAFMEAVVPRELRTLQAWRAYAAHVAPGGVLAANVIGTYYGSSAQVLLQVVAAAQASFVRTEVFLAGYGHSLWLPQNFIVVAQQATNSSMAPYVRYSAVEVNVSGTDILHDT